MPQRRDPDLDAQSFPAALLELRQGKIGLLGDPPAQLRFMRPQPGAAIAAHLLGPAVAALLILLPEALHAFAADAEALADFAGVFAARPCRNDALPQICAQWSQGWILMGPTMPNRPSCVYLNRKCSRARA